ncbi:hypothetical protein GCM10027059_05700 [Myceligenerans halotolerans]
MCTDLHIVDTNGFEYMASARHRIPQTAFLRREVVRASLSYGMVAGGMTRGVSPAFAASDGGRFGVAADPVAEPGGECSKLHPLACSEVPVSPA